MAYFDNAATTFPKPEKVQKTYTYWGLQKCINAGRGSYRVAAEAENEIEKVREQIQNIE